MVRRWAEEAPLPTTSYSVVVCKRSPTAHYPMHCGGVNNTLPHFSKHWVVGPLQYMTTLQGAMGSGA